MNKKLVAVILLLALLVFGVVIANKKDLQKTENSKLKVITTLFPLYDFSKEIGRDKVDVTLLLPAGVEAHSYSPKPADVVKINEADVFIYTGKYMEPWAEDLLSGLNNPGLVVVDTSKGIDLIEEEPEHPFEWAGVYVFEPGNYNFVFLKGPDPAMQLVVLKSSGTGDEAIEGVEEKAEEIFESKEVIIKPGDSIAPSDKLNKLVFSGDKSQYTINIKEKGTYVFFTEHVPAEFNAELVMNGKVMSPVAVEEAGAHHHGEDAGHNHHHGKDPHIWLDPVYAQAMVGSIAQAFVKQDPSSKEFYNNNSEIYINKLKKLDADLRTTFETCKNDDIIYGGHYAFGYFSKRYDLEHISPYKGFSPNAEPSPKAIIELIKTMKELDSKVIYYEELIDPKVAKVISEETGAELKLLHGAHNLSKEERKQGKTYLGIMYDNLENLKVGLECSAK